MKAVSTANKLLTWSYPECPEIFVAKSPASLKALINDTDVHKYYFLSKLQSMRSTCTLAIDHQRQCVANIK